MMDDKYKGLEPVGPPVEEGQEHHDPFYYVRDIQPVITKIFLKHLRRTVTIEACRAFGFNEEQILATHYFLVCDYLIKNDYISGEATHVAAFFAECFLPLRKECLIIIRRKMRAMVIH